MKYLIIGPEGEPVEVTKEQRDKWFRVFNSHGVITLSSVAIGDCTISTLFRGVMSDVITPFALELNVTSTTHSELKDFQTLREMVEFQEKVVKYTYHWYANIERKIEWMFEDESPRIDISSADPEVISQIIASYGKE